MLLYEAGEYTHAIQAATEAIAAWEQLGNPDPAVMGNLWMVLGRSHLELGNDAEAKASFEAALPYTEKMYGREHIAWAQNLDGLAIASNGLKDHARAVALWEEAVVLFERSGRDAAATAEISFLLAEAYGAQSDFDRAIPHLNRLRAIGTPTQRGAAANRLGMAHHGLGNLDQARIMFTEALASLEAAGAGVLVLAPVRANLGMVLLDEGDYARSEELLETARASLEGKAGHEEELADVYNALGDGRSRRGDHEGADRLREQALRANAAMAPGPVASAQRAVILANRAGDYRETGRYQEALALLEESLAVREQIWGDTDPRLAQVMQNLAYLMGTLRADLARAQELARRALALQSRLGPDHPGLAVTLGILGFLELQNGKLDEAKSHLLHALRLDPEDRATLGSLAVVHLRLGDAPAALEYAARRSAAQEREMARLMAVGTEDERLMAIQQVQPILWQVLTIALRYAREVPGSDRVALEAILREKGRNVESWVAAVDQARRASDPALAAQLDEWRRVVEKEANLRIAASELDATTYRSRRDEVTKRRSELETILGRSGGPAELVSLDSLIGRIPPGAALVEFITYHPARELADNDWSLLEDAFSLAACVARFDGTVGCRDLTAAGGIDEIVRILRERLADTDREDWRKAARRLGERVLDPLEPLLLGVTHLIVSPDRDLNVVPFEVVIDASGRLLIERASVSYLSSGRDLVRRTGRGEDPAKVVVIAGPDFDRKPTQGASDAHRAAGATIDYSQIQFPPLPGAAAEGKRLAGMLPSATFLTAGEASEQALKKLRGPTVLHVATHGFYLENLAEAPAGVDRARAITIVADDTLAPVAPAEAPLAEAPLENPLLRSGLALAGANAGGDGRDDGILTAMEAAALDLDGTELVVLSACETGLGQTRFGAGMIGIRSAFSVAGARSLLMSLWKVPDKETSDLMVAFYEGLGRGEGRAESLRGAKLALRDSPESSHPFYWAAFTMVGSLEPLRLEFAQALDQLSDD
jgi:CHAT domain-containing protein/Tfp pilus assembly protein PilF